MQDLPPNAGATPKPLGLRAHVASAAWMPAAALQPQRPQLQQPPHCGRLGFTVAGSGAVVVAGAVAFVSHCSSLRGPPRRTWRVARRFFGGGNAVQTEVPAWVHEPPSWLDLDGQLAAATSAEEAAAEAEVATGHGRLSALATGGSSLRLFGAATGEGDEYEMTLDRRDGRSLGISVENDTLVISGVQSDNDSLIAEWNSGRLDQQVSVGARIVEVNGCRKDKSRMMEGLTTHHVLRIKLTSVRFKLWRDNAAWCPYCQKVQLTLEEMRVPYRIEKVNMNCYGSKSLDFLAKNPLGLLPVAEVDGELITESERILEALVCNWRTRSLVPTGREKEVAGLIRLERILSSSWLTWLRAPADGPLREKFVQDLAVVESELVHSEGPYFLGADFSLVECHFAPSLERMAASLAYYKGFRMRQNVGYPRLELWFQAMENRNSYKALASDFYTHAHDLPPQIGGCAPSGENEACRRAIDGVGGGTGPAAWLLPLPVDQPPSPFEPLLANTAAEAAAARHEAAHRVLANRDKVALFSLRALGSRGFPRADARLSDPRAGSSGDAQLTAAVDEALRGVVTHLLGGDGKSLSADAIGPAAWQRGAGVSGGGELGECLAYLRDRIGVPRDMSFPAARQLRAHLNSYIEALSAAAA